MKSLKIISPGPFTSVQDAGRFGYQALGIPPSGVMDTRAFYLANLLVGNAPKAPVLEFTFAGATMEVLDPCWIALTGANMELTINKKPAPMWQSHGLKPGDRIQVGMVQSGCRGYLALTGGIKVPKIMGSCSTYMGANLGGLGGRCLMEGDIIERGKGKGLKTPKKLPKELIPPTPSKIILRAIPGPQDDYFNLDTFFGVPFDVTDKVNRMGYRLSGPGVERRPGMPKSIISEPSLPGGVQIPEDGQPIILIAEQTVGGYAKAATVISGDMDRIGQAVPGNTVEFQAVSLDQAHEIFRKRHEKQRELESMDLSMKTLASLGEDFFHDPVFLDRVEKYMIQI